MNLYAILRRDGFADGPTLEAAAARSTEVGNSMSDDIRWIRSYVLGEDSVGIDRALLADVRVQVPGLKKGAKVRVLFEDRAIEAEDGGFRDNFEGSETYAYEAGGVVGDLFGYVKDPDRVLPRMLPSGYGYTYGPTAVHMYEVEHE